MTDSLLSPGAFPPIFDAEGAIRQHVKTVSCAEAVSSGLQLIERNHTPQTRSTKFIADFVELVSQRFRMQLTDAELGILRMMFIMEAKSVARKSRLVN